MYIYGEREKESDVFRRNFCLTNHTDQKLVKNSYYTVTIVLFIYIHTYYGNKSAANQRMLMYYKWTKLLIKTILLLLNQLIHEVFAR